MTEEPPGRQRRPVPDKPQRPGPIGGDLAAGVHGLAQRFRMPSLMARHNSRLVIGAYSAINGLVSIALMSIAAVLTGAPFIFPSLGPTAFLVFYTPMAPAACPRNTVCGHAIGAAAGYLSLVVFGLTQAPPALTTSVTWDRVGAAALSLGLTAGIMVWLGVPHPPAGATTLIVSLGIFTEVWKLGVLMLAVAFLVVQAFVINRLSGIEYPIWSPRPPPAPASG